MSITKQLTFDFLCFQTLVASLARLLLEFSKRVDRNSLRRLLDEMDRDYAKKILKRIEKNEGKILEELTALAVNLARQFKLPSDLQPSDIAQEVLSLMLQNLREGKFKGNSTISTYLYRITANVCLNKRRQLRLVKFVDVKGIELAAEGSDPDFNILEREKRQLAAKIIRNLPDNCRELWRMMFWGRRNYSEIAHLLGVKEVTVRERMSRCRKMAREMLLELEN